MPLQVTFEKADIADAHELIEVQNRSFREDFMRYGECPAYEESPAAMESHIERAMVYKVLLHRKIVGSATVIDRGNGRYYVRVLNVVPDYQGFGIGQRLVSFLEAELSNAKEWELITPYRSYRNHHFYEKVGYRKVNEYRHSDSLIMYRYRKCLSAV